jgi:Ankyrin repeats (3 copies)
MNLLIMRFVIALLFAITVAYGILKQNNMNEERKNQDRSIIRNNTSSSASSSLSSSIRRTTSQPDLLQTNNALLYKKNIPIKRCQTAVSSLVSLAMNDQCDFIVKQNEALPPTTSDTLNDETYYVDDDNDCFESIILLDVEHVPLSDSPRRRNMSNLPKQNVDPTNEMNLPSLVPIRRLKPRGWIGLNHRAITHAKKRIVHMIHEQRMSAYKVLNVMERNELSSTFINTCSDDTSVTTVQLLSQSIPTQDFYIGTDGTESCALHSAAFHGCSQIIDFLCRGIDTNYYPALPCTNHNDESTTTTDKVTTTTGQSQQQLFTYNDGGLCDVNVTDMNGWTALHYAAGANSVDAVRVLVHYGASLHIPAVNGYTPLQWAIRLQHHVVANELRTIMTINQNEHQKQYWYQLCQRLKKSLPSILILSCFIIPKFGLLQSMRNSAS